MNDFLYDAREELKRADHLIFVSLKYTRTVDVLKHVIERLINCIDFLFVALLEDQKENGVIEEVPKAPIPKAKLIKECFSADEELVKWADFYMHLRRVSKSDFTRSTEFRRHVHMTVVIEDEVVRVDIDIVTSWYKDLKEFFEYVAKQLGEDQG